MLQTQFKEWQSAAKLGPSIMNYATGAITTAEHVSVVAPMANAIVDTKGGLTCATQAKQCLLLLRAGRMRPSPAR